MAKSLTITSAAVAIFIALLGVIGYLPGMLLLGRVRGDYIPMAPSTALCFIVLGSILLATQAKKLSSFKKIFLGLVFLVSLFGLLTLLEYFLGKELNFEHLVIPNLGELDRIPIGVMSPSTGALFFLSGIVIFYYVLRPTFPNRIEHLDIFRSTLSIIILFGSFNFCLSYLYGSPFLYNLGDTVPMALTTAIAFVFLYPVSPSWT
jgi:hypothetical protein